MKSTHQTNLRENRFAEKGSSKVLKMRHRSLGGLFVGGMQDQELPGPPFEPYKAATTRSRSGSEASTKSGATSSRAGLVHRVITLVPATSIDRSGKISFAPRTSNASPPRPVATVSPTASTSPTPENARFSNEMRPRRQQQQKQEPSTRSCGVQADEVGIDVDILLHVEEMVRTQRSLVLPSYSSLVGLTSPPAETLRRSEDHPLSLLECLQENERLREALALQVKVNNDLKRLVAGAMAGDRELADRLIGVTAESAASSRFMEAADSATIAADIWRAKCLACRVVAGEAGRKAARYARQVELTRHALAHLLGERTRLRTCLVEAVEALLPRETHAPVQTSDTLALAALCHKLARIDRKQTGDAKNLVVCNGDTPGEQLAVSALLNSQCVEPPDHTCESDPPSPIPPPHLPPAPQSPKDESDFVSKALRRFLSMRSQDTESTRFLACRHCRGDILDL
ncbi:Golgi to plasma membrane protein transport [Sparganum proliferum]